MPRETVDLKSFNRGLISPLALARTDLDRTALSAETFDNWMPRNLGSMMLRPGTKYLGSTRSDLAAEFIPFVFSTTDTALLEFTATNLRVWISDALVSRTAVSTALTNGTLDSDLSSWTDDDDPGGTSAWVTGGYLGLTGDGTNFAKRYQQVTVAAGDQSVEHALDIVIERGPVVLRVGSSANDDDYITETVLDTGSHSLTLTPTGNFFVEFKSSTKRQTLVDSCDVASSGTMTVTAPWAAADLTKLRFDQSGDIIYIAADGYQQYKVERRSTRSWSVVKYETNDGPFRNINIGPITIASSALTGNVTLTASDSLFKSTNVGGLYRITSTGQVVTDASITAQNEFTGVIKVTGVTSSRIFTVTIAGRVDSTITLQRSLTASDGPWEDAASYTADTTVAFDDSLDNQTAWYRIGIKTGDYGTDDVAVTLDYPLGSIEGIVRITAYSTALSVSAEVIVDLGGTSAVDDWYEGEWSTRRGFPTSVAFVEGRLGWAGRDKTWLSVSDSFSSFDDLTVGDSGPITRTIGSGPVDNINWMVATRRLLMGTDGSELSLRSSSEDEPLTPSNANIKPFETQGSAGVGALKLGTSAIFVQRGGQRLFEAAFGSDYEYVANDLTTFYPEAGDSPFTHIAVQRQPDTRIHCVRTDGDVSIMLHDKAENISCWIKYSSGGTVEDVVILPGGSGDGEDAVYYLVKRTVNSSTVRFLEKWSLESQCQGGTTSRQLDSHIIYSGASTASMTGLTHLEGETVAVWGGGKDLSTYTVSSGAITLSEAVTAACIGLAYTAQWKSSKLAYSSGLGTALVQKKNVTTLGVILRNTHYQGLKYGPDFTAANLDQLPLMKDEVEISADTVHTAFDEESFSFPGNWDTDSRLCLQAASPRPCTVIAAVIGMETHDRY